jgi:hypothetical protein
MPHNNVLKTAYAVGQTKGTPHDIVLNGLTDAIGQATGTPLIIIVKTNGCYRAAQRHAPQQQCLKLCIGVAQGTSHTCTAVGQTTATPHKDARKIARPATSFYRLPNAMGQAKGTPHNTVLKTTECYRTAQSRGTHHNNVLKTASRFRASQRHTR